MSPHGCTAESGRARPPARNVDQVTEVAASPPAAPASDGAVLRHVAASEVSEAFLDVLRQVSSVGSGPAGQRSSSVLAGMVVRTLPRQPGAIIGFATGADHLGSALTGQARESLSVLRGEALRTVRERIAQLVASATAPSAAAPAAETRTREQWTGSVFDLSEGSVWARLRNDDDGRDEDIELLPTDFYPADYARLRVGTALRWRFESWSEAGVRHTASKVELINPGARDEAAASAYANAWRRASAF